MRKVPCAMRRESVECQWFLTALSVRRPVEGAARLLLLLLPPRRPAPAGRRSKRAIAAQWLLCTLRARTMSADSYSEKGSRHTVGSSWLHHLGRMCGLREREKGE